MFSPHTTKCKSTSYDVMFFSFQNLHEKIEISIIATKIISLFWVKRWNFTNINRHQKNPIAPYEARGDFSNL